LPLARIAYAAAAAVASLPLTAVNDSDLVDHWISSISVVSSASGYIIYQINSDDVLKANIHRGPKTSTFLFLNNFVKN